MFPQCDGFRLLLLMAIDDPIAKNHRSVGTPIYIELYSCVPFTGDKINRGKRKLHYMFESSNLISFTIMSQVRIGPHPQFPSYNPITSFVNKDQRLNCIFYNNLILSRRKVLRQNRCINMGMCCSYSPPCC